VVFLPCRVSSGTNGQIGRAGVSPGTPAHKPWRLRLQFFRIQKWGKFQHYDKPRPPWIKIYTSINDSDTDWRCLLDHELGQLMRLSAYAALHENTLPLNAEYLEADLELDQKLDLGKFAKLGIIKVFPDKSSCLSREKSRVLSRKSPKKKKALLDQSSEFRVSEGRDQSKKKESMSGKPSGDGLKNKLKQDAAEVLEYLNQATGRAFLKTGNIVACLKREKCGIVDCKLVIDHKIKEWGSDPEMIKHLDATTPWRKAHFSDYLDQARAGEATTGHDSKSARDARISRLKD